MRLRRGTVARFALVDGTTVEGVVNGGAAWGSAFELTEAQFYTGQGAVEAAGSILIPRAAVAFVQIGAEAEQQ